MDTKLILAVAGSGKTRHLIESLSLERRAIILTYTINNTENLRKRVIQKFEYPPKNIRIQTYFSFLYQFCFQPLYQDVFDAKGITFNKCPKYQRLNDFKHYFTFTDKKLYADRLAKFFLKFKPDGLSCVKQRFEKYFDDMFVDEFQDFASYDFDFICELAKTQVQCQFVGDYHQHTFDTSRDGQSKKNLHQSKDCFLEEVSKHEIKVDTTTLSKSYRCSPSVASFVRERLGIEMGSQRQDETKIIFVEEQADATSLLKDDVIIKLVYQNSKKMDFFSMNWGASKGLDDFEDVCIILNEDLFKQAQDRNAQEMKQQTLNLDGFDDVPNKKQFEQVSAQTLNKLYVACTRAKGDIYFVKDTMSIA